MAITADDIRLALGQIRDELVEKGFDRPFCDFEISVTSRDKSWISAGDGASTYIYGDSPEDVLQKAREWVGSLKSVNDVRAEAFREKVASLLDEAKELGVSVPAVEAAVNPLTELMKKLSENVIEHRTAAE